ncbi:unnamed protein product [Peniophora sp. CBMAI 1063]|nr:unnamed protein product [Peniophora sp. CBMAI 1063]
MDMNRQAVFRTSSDSSTFVDDDRELAALGYKASFKREFSNLATISFAFSIMGVCSSVATTFNTPLLTGGPASVTWCWLLGATMCITFGASIAEIVSAYPTSGGLYTASAKLVPDRHRAIVGWVVGWLNVLGQIAGLASTEFGLSNMIWAAVVIAKDGTYEVTDGKIVGLFAGLLCLHGLLNSLATRHLARFAASFVFINVGATIIIIIVLLATTPRHEMHPAPYVFGSQGIVNETNGWPDGLAFLLGLLSVQWTMTGYDATAHITEEVRRAAYVAPAAIFIAVIGTGVLGWLLNITLVICSGNLTDLPGPSDSAFLQIMVLRMGKAGALFLWTFVCLTAFFVCQSGLQAGSRSIYAFSRDHGLPDRGFFSRISPYTKTPINAIWGTALFSILPGLLQFASPVAVNAIFALCAMALDLSYIVPIFLRRVFEYHPEVNFKPGPFYLGDGLLGWAMNINCICWTLFVSVIFSLPTVLPVTGETMNYASIITGSVLISSLIWYFLGGRAYYKGPASDLQEPSLEPPFDEDEENGVEEIVEKDV